MSHESNKQPAVIAHRGASAVAPENTLVSFREAIAQDADWLELDCRLTRDGKLAVFHDPDTIRIAGRNLIIAEMRMSELRDIDVGSWFSPAFAEERVVALEEVFHLAAGRIGVYVEIKSVVDETPRIPDMLEVIEGGAPLSSLDWNFLMDAAERISADSVVTARAVIDLMRAHKEQCRIVAQAFSPIIATVFRREAPDLRFEFLGMDLPEPPGIWDAYVAFGSRIGVAGYNINKESMTEERVRMFHDMGATCAVWVVDAPEHIEACVRCNVDAIITNKPAFCRDVLNRLD